MKIEFSGPRGLDTKFGRAVGILTENLEIWFQTLPVKEWHIGKKTFWYDGPIVMYGFGFFEVQWNAPI